MINLTLNQAQAQVLLNLLDTAVKSGGLQVAESAVFFANLIEKEFKAIAKDQNNEQL